ncbi:MAG: hypothetical protein KC464_18560 [Myxococcales bacterium]|nr:hypothetical protein [Myxococcales bacterium]
MLSSLRTFTRTLIDFTRTAAKEVARMVTEIVMTPAAVTFVAAITGGCFLFGAVR